MRSLALVVVSPLLVIVIACGGESSVGDDAYRDAAEQAARSAALTLEDLPDGWAPSSLGAETYTNFELTGDCARLNGRGAGFPGEVATADSESFAGPLGQELINTVSAFTDPDAASAAVRSANDLVLQCTVQLEDALTKAIQVAAKDRNLDRLLGDIDATVEPASFPTRGDETLAYSLKADFSALLQRFQVNGHIVVIRDGPLTGVMAYAALGDLRSGEEEGVATALASKLATAEATLSE
jgi:hypothetical protein